MLLDAGGPVAGLAGVDVDLREALAELAAHPTGLGPPAAYLGFRREKASVQGRRYQPAEALQQRGAVLDPTTVGLTSLTESAAQAVFARHLAGLAGLRVSAGVCREASWSRQALAGSLRLRLSPLIHADRAPSVGGRGAAGGARGRRRGRWRTGRRG
ncbi:MAG: hypothetical protein JWR70_1825, partial [Modestobacter sp.]|nr:hypothetical protein [Modestobacter sp.]